MFYVYIISSEIRNYIYVGLSCDVERRFLEHQRGYNKITKPYKPFRLIYSERFNTRGEARHSEKYLKSGAGKEWIRNILMESEGAGGGIGRRATLRG